MNLRVMAIGMPHGHSNMLFSTLAVLGLTGAPMAQHELFTPASAFDQNIAFDSDPDKTWQARKVLNEVQPGHYLPGYFFYSQAGASLLKQLNFKKILMVRDPRDIVIEHLVENSLPASYLSNYLQTLPDNFQRVRASILGFTEAQSGLPGIQLENVYRRFRYFTLWADEPDTLILRYEDLIDDSRTGNEVVRLDTLRRICEWLGLAKSHQQLTEGATRLAAFFLQQPNLVRTGQWRSYYSPDLRPLYKKYVGRWLQKFHYEESAEWVPPTIKKPVIAITLPKAGTHLLDKALSALNLQANMTLPLPVQSSLYAAEPPAQGLLAGIRPGEYILTHLFYNWNVAQLLNRLDFKKILIIRDPHDVVVSYIRYIQSTDSPEAAHFSNLPDDDTRLLDAIRGVLPIEVKNVVESLNGILSWLKEPDTLLIRFEDLIGDQGSGSRSRQLETLRLLAKHLELELDDAEVEEVAGKVFDRNALTFREGQIGTWQRYFKPQHHQLFNKFFDDTIERFGYRRYLVDGQTPAACAYPVLGIVMPGAGTFLLDIVLDELGLGRRQVITPFALSEPAETTGAVPLNLLSMYPNTYAAAQELFEGIKSNSYMLGSVPFSANGLEIVNKYGFKKIVLVREPRDAAVVVARILPDIFYPMSKYFRSLPTGTDFLMTAIKGVTPGETGHEQISLLGINKIVEHMANWSNQPDTLTVTYEQLVGEAGRGSRAGQLAAITAICAYLGLEFTASAIDEIINKINRRIINGVTEGYIGQWQSQFSKEHLAAIAIS